MTYAGYWQRWVLALCLSFSGLGLSYAQTAIFAEPTEDQLTFAVLIGGYNDLGRLSFEASAMLERVAGSDLGARFSIAYSFTDAFDDSFRLPNGRSLGLLKELDSELRESGNNLTLGLDVLYALGQSGALRANAFAGPRLNFFRASLSDDIDAGSDVQFAEGRSLSTTQLGFGLGLMGFYEIGDGLEAIGSIGGDFYLPSGYRLGDSEIARGSDGYAVLEDFANRPSFALSVRLGVAYRF